MKGAFDNSRKWLARMPASVFSTPAYAEKLRKAMEKTTGTSWVVECVPARDPLGGGFWISPTPDRLRQERMTPQDWRHLENLFEAVADHRCRRWYLFPDEILAALQSVGVTISV
jgi:hypothetical protein